MCDFCNFYENLGIYKSNFNLVGLHYAKDFRNSSVSSFDRYHSLVFKPYARAFYVETEKLDKNFRQYFSYGCFTQNHYISKVPIKNIDFWQRQSQRTAPLAMV